MRPFLQNRLTPRQKKLVALRLRYMGGYSYAFKCSVHELLASGFTKEELLSVSVDSTMDQWIDDAIANQMFNT